MLIGERMTKPSPLAYQWFQQALELRDDEEIFIPVSSKIEQRTLYKDIRKVAKEYSTVDKVKASRIEAVGAFRDGRLWIKIFIKPTSPLVGFKKGADGNTERIVLKDKDARYRQVCLMLSDKISIQKIIELMNLSPEEQEQMLGVEHNG